MHDIKILFKLNKVRKNMKSVEADMRRSGNSLKYQRRMPKLKEKFDKIKEEYLEKSGMKPGADSKDA